MRRLVVLVIVLSVSPASAQRGDWYDASDLLASLRAPERGGVVAQAQLGSASELPLYELSIVLADDLRSFELEETLWLTNRAGRPLSQIVLRVFANAVGEAPLVTLVRGECQGGPSCRVEAASPSAIVVRPAQPIAVGERLRVRLSLRGRLREITAERSTMMGQSLESLGGAHGRARRRRLRPPRARRGRGLDVLLLPDAGAHARRALGGERREHDGRPRQRRARARAGAGAGSAGARVAASGGGLVVGARSRDRRRVRA
ncbi:MAG: hypothetical protein M5U28_00920 [Sandaracinaceae bacterium]|nr:hypothetical protein [Sandaracinaceae bacterium]